MAQSKILAFSGSARKDSFNKKLLRLAVQAATDAGGEVTMIDLKDYSLPIMDEDLEREQGPPENATKLKQLFFEHQGLLLACPEYNSSITPLLKNVIDWVSRKAAGETPLQAYTGKVAGLLSASPGALGGLRGLVHVRSILGNIGVIVLPDQFAIPKAGEAFAADGSLKDAPTQAKVAALSKSLVETLAKLHT